MGLVVVEGRPRAEVLDKGFVKSVALAEGSSRCGAGDGGERSGQEGEQVADAGGGGAERRGNGTARKVGRGESKG